MRSMDSYPKAAMERAMKVQDVMLQAMARKITWWQAARTRCNVRRDCLQTLSN